MSTEAFVPVSFPRLRPPSATEAERARARERGYAEGHAEGYRVGVEAAAQERARSELASAAREAARVRAVDEALRALEGAVRALGRRADELTAPAEAEVFARAVDLAEVILAAELSGGEGSAASALRRAMASAEPEELREVRLHPDDLRALAEAEVAPPGVALTADDALDRGDAIAALADGHIDLRIRSAIDRARRAAAAGS